MAVNEIIEFLKRYDNSDCYTDKCVNAHRMAIHALEEIQQYRAIGTVEECREAVEKQKAKKPRSIDYKKRRLIDVDDVMAVLANHHFDDDKGNFDLLIHNLCKEVRLIPTAHDVDAVVRLLKEASFYDTYVSEETKVVDLDKAIEIEENGGIVKENKANSKEW